MCKNYYEMEFTHFVIDSSDGSIFGTARYNGRISNFIINGIIKQHTGYQWLELDEYASEIIRQRAQDAYGRVPIYRTRRLLI